MEIKIIKYILCTLLLTFAFTSCDKNEEAIATLENPKQSILTFKTFDEYNETLSKVNAMSKAERLVWENEQGFKSFGTICDEFYETIDPESFKSVDEVKAFVLKNSDKIELYICSDGETYCVTKEFKNEKRTIMNNKKMYIIGATVYKIIENTTYTTSISNIDELLDVNTIEDIERKSLIGEYSDNIKANSKSSIVTEDDAHGEYVIPASKWYRSDDTYSNSSLIFLLIL